MDHLRRRESVSWTLLHAREPDRERRALADLRRHLDLATERLDVTLDEREAKAGAFDVRAIRIRGSIELLEDACLLARRNARPVIADTDPCRECVGSCGD